MKPELQILIACMIGILALPRPGEAQARFVSRCGTGTNEMATGAVLFPADQLFCPLLADPKEPRSFLSYLRGKFKTLDDPSGRTTNIGAIGLGDTFGLVRWAGSSPADGVQLDVVGGIFAQFDLNADSNDLINADYVVGLPVTFRRRGFSARVKVYHQSSHLGDEYLLRDQEIERENVSFESLEVLVSEEVGPFRAYGGVERLFRRVPTTLAAETAHAGFEVRRGRTNPLRLVAAVDLKASRQHDWSPGVSLRGGIELAGTEEAGYPSRIVSLMLEGYKGPSPYGQFFQDDIRYFGIGLHLGF